MTIDAGVEAFLRRYFGARGNSLREERPGILDATLPESLRPAFEGAVSLRITFDPATIGTTPSVELAAPGSYLLDRVVEDATSVGLFSVSRIEAGGDSPEAVVARSFRPKNATVAAGTAQVTPVAHVLFNFLVRLTSDERFERFESILIDPRTGQERHADRSVMTKDLPVSPGPRPDPQEIGAQYRAACRALEVRLQPIVQALRDRAQLFLKEETERIRAYFDRSARELLDMKAATAPDELRALEFERERRLAEAEEKYRLVAEVELCNVRTLVLDVTDVSAILSNRGARRVVPLAYNSLDPTPILPRCEVCSAPVPEPFLCFGGHLAGPECVKACDFCDTVYCRTCCSIDLAIVTCSTCARAVCPDHIEVDALSRKVHCPHHILACAICGRNVGPEYVRTCRTCEQSYCAVCVAPPSDRCVTCRTLRAVSGDDPPIADLRQTDAGLARATKWRHGSNHRYTIVAAKALVWNQLLVLDAEGAILLRKKMLGV